MHSFTISDLPFNGTELSSVKEGSKSRTVPATEVVSRPWFRDLEPHVANMWFVKDRPCQRKGLASCVTAPTRITGFRLATTSVDTLLRHPAAGLRLRNEHTIQFLADRARMTSRLASLTVDDPEIGPALQGQAISRIPPITVTVLQISLG